MKKQIDTKSTSLREITTGLLNYADTFSFVIREKENLSREAFDLIRMLEPFLIEVKEASEWPGTKIFWEQATLFKCHLNHESEYLLSTAEDNIFKWLQPYLPEDLVFYKCDLPVLVSITHERVAYFEVENCDESLFRARNLIV